MNHPIEPVTGPLYAWCMPIPNGGGLIQVFPSAVSRQILDGGEFGIPVGEYGLRVVHIIGRDGATQSSVIQNQKPILCFKNMEDIVFNYDLLVALL